MRRSLIFVLFALMAWRVAESPAGAFEPQSNSGASQSENTFSSYEAALDQAATNLLKGERAAPPERVQIAAPQQPSAKDSAREMLQLDQFAKRYWKGREADFLSAVKRMRQLQPELEGILRNEGVPAELVAVVLIESAGRTTASSPREARGLWQFIPATARRYGLAITPLRDDRLDVAKSTRAAARYLRDLYLQFEDWRLALAAYNAGEQAVQRAIDRSGRADFGVLSSTKLLPEETRAYVPAVLAAVSLFTEGADLTLREGATKNWRSARTLYATTSLSFPVPAGRDTGDNFVPRR